MKTVEPSNFVLILKIFDVTLPGDVVPVQLVIFINLKNR